MSFSFTEEAALALAPAFREKYDFTEENHYKLFAEQTWKAAQALADKRPVEVKPSKEAAK